MFALNFFFLTGKAKKGGRKKYTDRTNQNQNHQHEQAKRFFEKPSQNQNRHNPKR